MRRALIVTVIFSTGFALGSAFQARSVAHAQAAHVFELRTYTAPEGKLADLHKRFRDHTRRIFEKHGMKSVAYWTPQDAPLSQNTLIYILEHPSREAATKNWNEFRADPEWQKVAAESVANGPITTKIESVFMVPTDFSPLK